eukprot:gene4794-5421_t
MQCRECESYVADATDLFSFFKGPNDIHFALKPERRAGVEERSLVIVRESKKKVRVKCKKCLENIGVDVPFGPRGTRFVAFGLSNVILIGCRFSAKRKWSEVCTQFSQIEKRNEENFFGQRFPDPGGSSLSNLRREPTRPDSIKFPCQSNRLHDFEWYSLTPEKKARSYQVEAYVEALQRDLVVILDTGLGKTLIASMVMSRMKQLNPHRMTLMLVDRIPLVFQQGRAIMDDTGLRVCCICGENRTERRMKQLHDGTFDVLVITAGCFNELINQKCIQIDDFSVIVFDECHHATGGHVYAKILDKIAQLPKTRRPRVLGLTASPFKAENQVKGRNKLRKFRAQFLGSSFFYPNTENLNTKPEQVTYSNDELQIRFKFDAMKIIRSKSDQLSRIIPGCDVFPVSITKTAYALYQLKGEIRAIQQEYVDNKELGDVTKSIILLIDSIEVCELIGVQYAVRVLSGVLQLPDDMRELKEKYTDRMDVPSRLSELEEILQNCTTDTRTIVFVRTQTGADILASHLTSRFPDLNTRKMFGHGGYYGMDWEDEQQQVLKEFRDGTTRLIVSTSVLEEGLDVAQCNMVIRYSGPNTLISFIQSRGRARSTNSRYLVFIEESQQRSVVELEKQEELLRFLVNNEGASHRIPTELSREIIAELKRDDDDVDFGEVGNGSISEASGQTVSEKPSIKDTATFQFLVRLCGQQELILSDKLVEELEQFDSFKVQRVFVEERVASEASGVYGVFTEQDRSLLVSLQNQFGCNVLKAYEEMCKVWNFKVSDSSDFLLLQVWSRITHCSNRLPIGDNTDEQQQMNLYTPRRIEFGRFNSWQVFEVSSVFDATVIHDQFDFAENMIPTVSSIKFISKWIEIDFRYRYSCPIMTIALTDIYNFALMSFDDNTPCLYLPLTSTPMMNESLRITQGHALLDAIADCPVVAIAFDKSTWGMLHRMLSNSCCLPVPVFDTRVVHKFALEKKDELHRLRISLTRSGLASEQIMRILWKLRILESKRNICLLLEDSIYLHEKLVSIEGEDSKLDVFEHALEQVLTLSNGGCYWFDVKEAFKKAKRNVKKLSPAARSLIEVPIPANHILIKRVVVTPSRVICMPALPIASNRMLRNYGDKYEFIVVLFRDEQLQKMQEADSMILRRIEMIMKNGFEISKHYWFFCASASQMRDHKAYFVAAETYEEVKILRSKIVENECEFTSTAKYLSRLGLFCSADKPVKLLHPQDVSCHDDVKALNGDIVTDGCGKIKRSFAIKIAEELGVEGPCPSAFQIRKAGVKGVVVVDDDCDNSDYGENSDNPTLRFDDGSDERRRKHWMIQYRPSMLKFKSSDEMLCVVSTARYNNLFLNREVITLLTSINAKFASETEWSIENTITEMHEKAICDAAGIFEDTKSACLALMQYMPKPLLERIVSSGYDILSEPYWFSLLQTAYRLAVTELRFKTRIPVEKACLLMGVADPVGLLQDDEIFVQIKEDERSPSKVIIGRVLIYRNPCLHPGDLRLVTAVNQTALAQLMNVVVMPTRRCRSSLPAQCSGGDLDGDEFAVVWDPRFIPPFMTWPKPLDYAALANGAPKDYDTTHQQYLFADLYKRVIANDSLGRVAHMHLALCDMLPDGACDPLAMSLAESQSQAVDFPKTGITPMVPIDAIRTVKSKGYPDFMEKKGPTYISEKLIGKLYRRCRSLMFDFELSTEKKRLDCDLDLVVDGNKAYIRDAIEQYKAYTKSFKALMVRFYLKRESEVILARPIKWNTLLNADRGAASKALAACYDALVKRFRNEFFRDVCTDEETTRKASAWYRVAYDKSLMKEVQIKVRLRSFAWLVGDHLCSMKNVKQLRLIERPNMVCLSVGETVCKEFLDSRMRLESSINTKENARRCVEAEINRATGRNAFSVRSYGSVSMYLCEPESDLDISIKPLRKAMDKWGPSDVDLLCDNGKFWAGANLSEAAVSRHFLETVISAALDKIANTKKHKLDAKVPLISITVGDEARTTCVDVTIMNKVGELKTSFVQALYKSRPMVYPLLWILVRWARCVGMVKSAENNECVIATAEFYILLIHLMRFNEDENVLRAMKNHATKGSNMQYYKICELIKVVMDCSNEEKIELGDMLTTFFRRGVALKGDIELVWPRPDIPNVQLDAKITELIATHCMNGLHTILATRNVYTMLSYARDVNSNQTDLSKKLKYALSNAIGSASSFHAAMLSSLTGARVEITPQDGRSLLMKATGTRAAIMKLKEELHNLSVTNKALKLGRLPKKTSRYFMEGATMLMTREATSSDTMVKFEPSPGPYNILHRLRERHNLVLSSQSENDWMDGAVNKLSELIGEQMRKFPMKNKALLDSMKISVVFGSFYTVEISRSFPPSQPAESLGMLEQKVEKNRRNRRNWERGEFTGPQPKKSEDDSVKSFAKTNLKKASGGAKMKSFSRNNKKKSTVTSAFCPGILERNSSSPNTVAACRQIFVDSLRECGFVHGTNGYMARLKGPWKVHSVPSTSYEVIAQVGNDLKVTEVTERALKWACGNVLHGKVPTANKELMRQHDFRVNVITKDTVHPDSKLYKTIVPTDSKQIFNVKAGKPEFLPEYPKENRVFTSMVLERKEIDALKKKNFDALVVTGVEHRGKDLALPRKFCDISLEYNPDHFKETLREDLFSTTFKEIAEEILQTATKLSDVINRKCPVDLALRIKRLSCNAFSLSVEQVSRRMSRKLHWPGLREVMFSWGRKSMLTT